MYSNHFRYKYVYKVLKMLDVSSDDLFSLVATANRRINKNIMGKTCQNSGNGNRRHPKLARKPKQLCKTFKYPTNKRLFLSSFVPSHLETKCSFGFNVSNKSLVLRFYWLSVLWTVMANHGR